MPSYYLRYFYEHDEVLDEQRSGTPRAQVVAEIERELLELYRDPALTEKPALLEQRGGAFYSEAATALVGSLFADAGDIQVDRHPQRGHARRAGAGRRRRGPGADRRVGPGAARHRRRWRRSCSAWRSTWRRTSG